MIQSARELENSREKLRILEKEYEAAGQELGDNEEAKEAELQSLRGLINQFKEEIARYEARLARPAKSE